MKLPAIPLRWDRQWGHLADSPASYWNRSDHFRYRVHFNNGHVRTGENRHEKQRENKPFKGNAEKEEYKEEPEKIERGEKVSNVIPSVMSHK